MGVSKELIDKYTVYSSEVAKDMSKVISSFTNSNYGIGVTGKLNRVDKNNPYGEDNIVYISIYNRDSNIFNEFSIKVDKDTRAKNKEMIIDRIVMELKKDFI